MPFDVVKASDAPSGKRYAIRGIISTEHRDLQGEIILQDGMDLRPFLKRGVFNDNHDGTTGRELGVPTKTFQTRVPGASGRGTVKATVVEGYLTDDEDGCRIYNKAVALKKLGRSLGFSVEGKVLERDPRDPKRCTRTLVRQVAITRVPVNPNTALEPLVKSLDVVCKGMDSGGGLPARGASTTSAAPLTPQDLDGRLSDQGFTGWAAVQAVGGADPNGYGVGDFDVAAFGGIPVVAATRRPVRSPSLTRSQAVAVVRRRHPYATDDQVRGALAKAVVAHGGV